MPRGAPQGNQYAKKAQRRRGITVSHYIRADVLDYFREFLQFETGKSDDEAVRERVSKLIEEAINQDMRRVFEAYKASHKPEESSHV